jgi:peptide methionine sulfoxide reductase msrA/msrB
MPPQQLNPNLSDLEKKVMFDKATERPFTGEFDHHFQNGLYICKNCGKGLYYSQNKFDSRCGWPAFETSVNQSVRQETDMDGRRTEILCNHCGIHLGHVFVGEKLTATNTRHCVNSASLSFIDGQNLESVVLGCGCFWGVEYLFQKLKGVVITQVGYSGGSTQNPNYQEVCSGRSGYFEVLKIVFDQTQISYTEIIKYFFEIHDFEQTNGQGPDLGSQYESVIFVKNPQEKIEAQKIIQLLENKNYKVATKILDSKPFYEAEKYHQNYYQKNGKTPYCHLHKKIF